MELIANEAGAYLIGGQLTKRKREGKVLLYKIQGQTQLHIHLGQYKTSLQYRERKKRKKKKDKHSILNIDKTLNISITLK